MRNQVYKKQHPKWESNFSAFTEIDETEIELEGVTNVVDFTSTVFSVENQSHIHLICENESGKREIRQIYVEQTYPKAEDKFVGKIDLVETKVQDISDIGEAFRIFHVDENIFVLTESVIHKYDVQDLSK